MYRRYDWESTKSDLEVDFLKTYIFYYVMDDIIHKSLYITVPSCQQDFLCDAMKLFFPHCFMMKSILMRQKVANRSL